VLKSYKEDLFVEIGGRLATEDDLEGPLAINGLWARKNQIVREPGAWLGVEFRV